MSAYHLSDRNVQRNGDTRHARSEEFGYLAGFIAKCRAALQPRIPLGYEDETGFHIGVMSPGENSQ